MAPPSNMSAAFEFDPPGAPIEEQSFLAKAASTQQEKLEKLKKRMMGPQLHIPLKSKKDKGMTCIYYFFILHIHVRS